MSIGQKPLFRDVWALGPPSTGYPGAFPRGLINRIRERWWGKDRLWLFSGGFKDPEGTTVDIKKEVQPDHVCNCEQLPFEDETFDFVMLDPPYSQKEARDLYGLPYHNILKVMDEAARVCRTGGHVILLHRLIPWYHPWESIHKKRLKPVAVVGVYTIAGYSNLRALTVWRKQAESARPARKRSKASASQPHKAAKGGPLLKNGRQRS